MPSDINTLRFTHGAVQTSPTQALQLNQQAPTAFFDETIESSPGSSGYQIVLSGYSVYIRQQEK